MSVLLPSSTLPQVIKRNKSCLLSDAKNVLMVFGFVLEVVSEEDSFSFNFFADDFAWLNLLFFGLIRSSPPASSFPYWHWHHYQ